MKILRIINSLQVGGAERSIVTNVPIHKNRIEMDILLLNGADSIFLDKLKNKNVRIFSLGKKNNIYNPFLIFKLRKYFYKYDIIHAHLFPTLYWVAFAKIISFTNTPIIFTEHSTDNKRRHRLIFKPIDKFVYHQYQKIISISDATTFTLSKYLNIPDKIITIPNGVDFTEFNQTYTLNKMDLFSIPNEKIVLLQIAGFRKEKDQDTVIKAMTLLPNQFHAVFAGNGERLNFCKQLAEELHVSDRISFIGIRDDIPQIINASDVVIMSSHHEGFGRAVIESMYLGKPIIASNVPGLADLVKGTGLLFETGDFETLAELINSIFNDSEKYKIMSEKSKIKALEYDVKFMIDGYEKLYKEIFDNLNKKRLSSTRRNNKHKLLRITTISGSLAGLLKGQLRFLNQYYDVVGVASDNGSLQEVSEREGIRVINVPMERDINLWKDLISLLRMIRLIRHEKPNIVHTNTPKGSLLGMLASWWCRVPIRIYTVTGLRFETASGNFKRLLIMMEKITCACATKVIPEGDGVKNTLIKNKITKKPLKKILNGNINGIDAAYFDPTLYPEEDKRLLRKDLNIGEKDFVFIYVGRLVKDKGINELVAAFGRLKSESNRFLNNDDSTFTSSSPIPKLLLVGRLEQELDPLFPETLEKIQNDHDIIYVGYQDDVRPYFAISDVLAFPSYREGFPNVVMQAGAMGLPSIVTNINGCNEIILEGKNGIIIPPKNEEALFEAMKYIMKHSTERQKMAEAARPLITSRYEQQLVWEALLEEYRSLETAFEKKNRQKNKRRTRNK